MRSRYSAYALGLMDYVSQTWHASTRADDLPREAGATLQWINLRVLAHTPAADGLTATVEFVATYRVGGRAHKLHELSRFVFEGERWWYVDAATDPARDASRPNPQS